MQETHGWGQHINAYKEVAVDHLQETGGEMNSEGLGLVVAAGAELRRKYCEGRVLKFVAQERRSLARIMAEIPRDGFLEEDDILDPLVKEYGAERGRELFFLSVQKGVFYYNNDRGGYSGPIPSMRDWLMKHFPPKKDFESGEKLGPRKDLSGKGSQKESLAKNQDTNMGADSERYRELVRGGDIIAGYWQYSPTQAQIASERQISPMVPCSKVFS